jgi:hypothetical protein
MMMVAAGVAATLLGGETLWAQAKSNAWIAERIESTGTGNYLLAMLVVLGATVLMGLGMLRRSRR